MSKPFKMKSPLNLNNLGVGDNISPYKDEEEKEEKVAGWKGALGMFGKMVKGGLDKVYGKVEGEKKKRVKVSKDDDDDEKDNAEIDDKEEGEVLRVHSPAKARQSSRGGKRAGKATKTARRRGGYAKSTGKRGAGGRNVGGYNVQTRFQPRKTEPTGELGTSKTSSGGGDKPYSYNKQGGIVINNYAGDGDQTQSQTQSQTQGQEWVPPVYGEKTTTSGLPTYQEAWDMNNKNVQSKYENFEDFQTDAIKWNKENKGGGGTTSKTEKYVVTPGYYKPTTGSQSQTQTQSQTSGAKFKGKLAIGGYRAMYGQ